MTVDKILAKLKEREKMHAGNEQRRHSRQPLRDCGSVLMRIVHPGGSTAQCTVLPRDVSVGGMSVLHGSFLHTGTRVHVGLLNVQGDRQWFSGVAVRCSYFESRVHELGIKFDMSVPIHDFLRADADGGSVRRELVGKVLYVEPSVDFRELLRFQCARMGVNITTTESGEEAVEMVDQIDFDAVLVEMKLPDLPGEAVIERLSQIRPKPTIVAMTMDDDDGIGSALPPGCEAMIQKPVQEGDLYQLMATFLPTADSINSGAPLCSTYWSDTQLRPVISAFVERLPESLDLIRDGLSDPDPEELLAEALRVKNAAGGYGFPSLGEALGKLIKVLQVDGEPSDQALRSAWMEVEQLARLAEQFMQAQGGGEGAAGDEGAVAA